MNRSSFAIITLMAMVSMAVLWVVRWDESGVRRSGVASETSTQLVSNLSELVELAPSGLERMEIAQMNLLCAQGLPGAEPLNLSNSFAMIDQMADRVRSETERHLYRFEHNPAEFENSEGFFRMTLLMVVLAEDFQVHYASNKIAVTASISDGFFADSRYVFLHELTGSNPQGTCSSLPVLQVAVGRRLGYPLKLVTTKGHLFVRWEDARERFNFEAAGKGASPAEKGDNQPAVISVNMVV